MKHRTLPLYEWVSKNNPPPERQYGKGWWDTIEFYYSASPTSASAIPPAARAASSFARWEWLISRPVSGGVFDRSDYFIRKKEVWIFDARSNVPGITKKDRPLTAQHFAEFEAAYGKDPNGLSRRKDTGELGRLRRALTLLQHLAAKVTWAHNVLLIQKIKSLDARLWYMRQTIEHGWSHSILALQIDSHAFERHGKAVHNFHATLPPPQSDLAEQVLKDPYIFAFRGQLVPQDPNDEPASVLLQRIHAH